MALGGMVFGMYGAQRPFGGGLITHPCHDILRAGGWPGCSSCALRATAPWSPTASSSPALVIGIASYFLGTWFGTELLVIR